MLSQNDYIALSAKLIEDNIQKIFKGMINFSKDQYKKMQVKAQDSFKKYLDTTIRKYSFTKTILHKHSPIYIYDLYVSTNLLMESDNATKNYLNTDNINNLFELSKSIIITGTGGCGKSTLFKHLFLNSIEKCNCIPIYIELKDLKNFDSNIDIIDYVYHSLTSMNLQLEKEYFLYAFDQCNIVLFFDGFDEVDDSRLEKVTNDIIRLNNKYSNLHTLVSSRPIENGFASWTNFVEMNLIPMTKEQSIELISKVKFDNVIKNNFLNDLECSLYDKFESFASNPLLLTIMLLTYSDYAEIPDKMHLFYEEAFEVLYRKHDANKEGVFIRGFKTQLSKDQFEKLLSCFSLLSYYENHFSFRRKEVIEYIDRSKKLTGIEVDSELYLTDLIQSVCMLQLEGNKYSYTHRSFQEYFTAIYILNSGHTIQKKLLIKMPLRYNIDTVLSLLFDMNKSMVEESLIIPVLQEIKLKIDYENVSKDQALVNFLKLNYEKIRVVMVSSDEANAHNMYVRVLLKYTNSEGSNRQYIELIRFIYSKYSTETRIEKAIPVDSESYKNFFENTHYDIDDLLTNEHLHNIFIPRNNITRQIELSLDILDELIEDHRYQEESIDSFLTT